MRAQPLGGDRLGPAELRGHGRGAQQRVVDHLLGGLEGPIERGYAFYGGLRCT